MRAFLLAAGKGTRLRPYTDSLPKCMIPIHGKPLLEIWIDLLCAHGIDTVLINTHHHADQVHAFVDHIKGKQPIHIRLVHEPALLGSAGTVWKNRDFVKDEDDFVIAYADNLTDLDLTEMIDFHREYRSNGGVLTMGLFSAPNPSACGIAVLDQEKRIIDFYEKPQNPMGYLANAGIYIAANTLFKTLSRAAEENQSVFDLGHHVLPALTGKMFGYPINGYIRDIGTVSSYRQALTQWPLKER